MPIGQNKYEHNDIVEFKVNEDTKLIGRIFIVDKYGVFEDPDNVYYDIMVKDILYKHIVESDIIGKIDESVV